MTSVAVATAAEKSGRGSMSRANGAEGVWVLIVVSMARDCARKVATS